MLASKAGRLPDGWRVASPLASALALCFFAHIFPTGLAFAFPTSAKWCVQTRRWKFTWLQCQVSAQAVVMRRRWRKPISMVVAIPMKIGAPKSPLPATSREAPGEDLQQMQKRMHQLESAQQR